MRPWIRGKTGQLVAVARAVEDKSLAVFLNRVRQRHTVGFAEIGFSVGFQLAQDSRGDFLRGVLVPVDFNHGGTVGASHDFVGSVLLPMFDFGRIGHAPHQTLDRKNGTAGVRHGLTLGGVTDQALLISEGYHGRGRTAAVRVGDAFGVLAFHHIDTTVRRAEVNANDFAHNTFLLEDSHPIKR